jgi:hypothetical protein
MLPLFGGRFKEILELVILLFFDAELPVLCQVTGFLKPLITSGHFIYRQV